MKAPVADARGQLAHAVIVDGHGTGADVYVFAYLGVAQIAEMDGLGVPSNLAAVHLGEVAEDNAFGDAGTRSNVGEGPDVHAGLKLRAFDYGRPHAALAADARHRL